MRYPEHHALQENLASTYPVIETVPREVAQAIGLKDRLLSFWKTNYDSPADSYAPGLRAVWTGETRCPKKGEWYLSGALIGAYYAPNDLSAEFPIAQLVWSRRVFSEEVTPIDIEDDGAGSL